MAQDKEVSVAACPLMADVEQPTAAEPTAPKAADTVVPIELMHPNPDQPRGASIRSLDDLARSIAEKVSFSLSSSVAIRLLRTLMRSSPVNAAGAPSAAKLHEVPILIRVHRHGNSRCNYREHPALKPQSNRRSCGISTAYGEIRPNAGADGDRFEQEPFLHCQQPSAADFA